MKRKLKWCTDQEGAIDCDTGEFFPPLKAMEIVLENLKEDQQQVSNDVINHPSHYTQGKIECIEVTETMPFLEGSAIKYLWRHKFKNGAEDIKKAIWYCKRILKTQYNEEVV